MASTCALLPIHMYKTSKSRPGATTLLNEANSDPEELASNDGCCGAGGGAQEFRKQEWMERRVCGPSNTRVVTYPRLRMVWERPLMPAPCPLT